MQIISSIKKFIRDVRVDQYKKNYMPRILLSKPIICDNLDFELHVLTCKIHFLMTIWCLKTFYFYSGLRPTLVVHEDGSLSQEHVDTFAKHFVNCRIIRRKNANKEMDQYLSAYPYSRKARATHYFYCSLKFFDAFYYAQTEKFLYLDSDILFFKHPAQLIQLMKDNKPFFNSDYQNAYAHSWKALCQIMGMDILPHVNAGMTGMHKKWFMENVDLIEDYLEKGQNWRKGGNINQHEQTLAAILLSKYNAVRLSEHYQISKKPVTDRTVSHHFVIDGSRVNFFLVGIRYLKRHNFLKKFEQCS